MGNIGVLMNDTQTTVENVPLARFSTESAHKEENGDKKIKIIKIVFGILCFFLVAELIIYKYVMPAFSSPKVTVSGQKLYTAEEIAEKLLPMMPPINSNNLGKSHSNIRIFDFLHEIRCVHSFLLMYSPYLIPHTIVLYLFPEYCGIPICRS